MSSIHIKEPYKIITPQELRPLRIFAQKKDASSWCKENGVKPARIVKLKTKFQETYALDMGLNCFLLE